MPQIPDLNHLLSFIGEKTPEAWLEKANNNIELLLIDHAHCERKAAATAINFISKYPEHQHIASIMSPLAREELLHFEKVLQIMNKRAIKFCPLKPSRYGQHLHTLVVKGHCHQRIRDQLIVGAIIEARSCERFYALTTILKDQELVKFFTSLLRSEARHFQDYLTLAASFCDDVSERAHVLVSHENEYIVQKDEVFRFHSGV